MRWTWCALQRSTVPSLSAWHFEDRSVCVGVGQWDRELPVVLVAAAGDLQLWKRSLEPRPPPPAGTALGAVRAPSSRQLVHDRVGPYAPYGGEGALAVQHVGHHGLGAGAAQRPALVWLRLMPTTSCLAAMSWRVPGNRAKLAARHAARHGGAAVVSSGQSISSTTTVPRPHERRAARRPPRGVVDASVSLTSARSSGRSG